METAYIGATDSELRITEWDGRDVWRSARNGVREACGFPWKGRIISLERSFKMDGLGKTLESKEGLDRCDVRICLCLVSHCIALRWRRDWHWQTYLFDTMDVQVYFYVSV